MRPYLFILLSNFTRNKRIRNYVSAKLYVQKKRRIIKIVTLVVLHCIEFKNAKLRNILKTRNNVNATAYDEKSKSRVFLM